ncbi:ATP-binding cassette domain-containing protein [Paenibacillus sp. NEAU-GSW1]|uniref:ATP-binding cassette domain-containing protein n=1 Tax=Paenibacillus sp. NEAU-GSW1 TaxID=2682486 RepID=UPI0012E171BD|nr:ATP-binding cassette domain-containing protein [Paenibacillus sp. NEAU-GSW1]MUT66439.1 ATP-binding cassette domain-containing protein [Paenibacillus sp. NEAU-GSW1]
MSNDWLLQQVTVVAPADGGNKEIIRQLNARFKQGRITLLVGGNGAGKSTLLETIAGLRSLEEGTISKGELLLWQKGRRKKRINRSVSLATGIALQHSESQWFAATVKAEFQYSLKPYKPTEEERDIRIAAAMQAVGLSERLLAADPWTLSGGQQRRLSLACLLACRPEWLLLDEPTSGLDGEGTRKLMEALKAHRDDGGGAIIATHDLDALLPLADDVIVLENGAIREMSTAAEWAAKHAKEPSSPQALQLLTLLGEAGFHLPEEGEGNRIWPTPADLAASIAEQAVQMKHAEIQPALVTPVRKDGDDKALKRKLEADSTAWNTRFDPRAIIISYLLLATAILVQGSWIGIAAAAVVTMAVLLPLRAQTRPWSGVIRGYSIMIAVISLVSGFEWNPLGFNQANALTTLQRFSVLMFAMMLGLPMLGLVTPLRVQRAFEQTFGWLGRMKVPVRSFALIVTLIFRFIPLLSAEWQRFAAIAHARGKASSPAGKLPASMLLSALVPYIRSLLRIADQLADALEARGIGHPLNKPTRGLTLRFRAEDTLLVLGAGAASALLYMLDRVL